MIVTHYLFNVCVCAYIYVLHTCICVWNQGVFIIISFENPRTYQFRNEAVVNPRNQSRQHPNFPATANNGKLFFRELGTRTTGTDLVRERRNGQMAQHTPHVTATVFERQLIAPASVHPNCGRHPSTTQ